MKSHRLHTLPQGIFKKLAEHKEQMKRQGRSIIDLSIGSPDLPPHPEILDALSGWAADPSAYGYTLKALPSFNEAVADFYDKRYKVAIDPNHEVLQLSGTQDGLSQLALSCINPGDLALIPDPAYPIYEIGVLLAGGRVIRLPLKQENRYLVDFSSLPSEVLERAKLLYLNYPGNPIPEMAPLSFFEEVVFYAKKYDIKVIHDFAYSELVYDGRRAHSFLSVPGAKEVGVEFNSLSKTFSMAGCRIGYMAGNQEMVESLASLMSHTHYGIFLPVQKAAEKALRQGEILFRDHVNTYQRRRDFLVQRLREAGWEVSQPPATMFIWARIPYAVSSMEFCEELMEETGVVLVPGETFGKQGEGYVRISLVQPETLLDEAVRRIKGFLEVKAGA
ncbi:aminotransferase class I/II-fold pyridoxal phosphate-dependent enzyme [Thermoactinomyces sp. CICC 10522]|uniref:aminotransferase class I/II-fold pyridoxal phosphate-dependent enzyme n=1 Tax=Thermoactinomyces sp. CICC 10522 TaxID=2767427 RepID=UPI0018DDD549|nr:aminotransferase class I/II-fold pyridoxal phosphate-dependent enzyme [Thermoactinomyces sp. CICC 10522]MBH8603749.1 aminotransferase class I/II-fold pyridoxal phosphate-dependent enzyme [Thermoactinomyces sp. CICC 10522]